MKIKRIFALALMLLCACAALAQAETAVPWSEFLHADHYAQAGMYNGRTHYIHMSTGETTVMTDGGDTVWLRESSDGMIFWFGLDSSAEIGKPSRFYVRLMNQYTDPDDDIWNNCYNHLDSGIKEEAELLWVFDMGVCSPDGTMLQPANAVTVYAQIEDGWNPENVKVYRIGEGGDEPIEFSVVKIEEGEHMGTYAAMQLSAFSPCVFYELAAPKDAAVQ